MAFSPDELANINNAALEEYLDKGKVWKQAISNKPMLADFNAAAGQFSGGKEAVSVAVKAGTTGNGLQGYTGDDQVGYYNPTGLKRARYPWKEHHIGMVVTHTELKTDGIDVDETGSAQRTSEMDGREDHVLANLLDEKNDTLGEDYAFSLDRLLHGDGSSDAKALAGIRSIILDSPTVGQTGNIDRTANPFWQNRAATAANATAGGQGPIVSSAAGGGALLQFLQGERRRLSRYRSGASTWKWYAGSDWIGAYEKEIRGNGYYTQSGFMDAGKVDGAMGQIAFNKDPIVYDPTLDDLGFSKRCYVIDVGKSGIRLLYMDGQRMKKHNPARPYDRYVLYNGITMTGVLIAKQLNTSGVYDIS